MIKLIVTDLDGTLLNDKKEIPEGFWEVQETLHKQGVHFAIASGRPLHNIFTNFEKIKDRIFFISDNGSYVVYQGRELWVDPMLPQDVKNFVELSRTIEKSYPILCGKQMAFMEDRDEDLLKIALQYYQEFEIVDDLTKVTEPILKISLCDLVSSEKNSYPYFSKFENNYKIAVSGKVWLDITNYSADKGNAVKRIRDLLNISYDETMVFGDLLNDLQLMQSAKYSYAMKNAHPAIIEAANYTTEYDNNHDGVVSTIRQVCL